eukprot:TRINITY_DN7643_c0_g4_i1.p1 TRINITY_DN7643_c0_g4~~TRINITY_DN7643_c0_g4_i1.p1  ORF type:complete len:1149 (-),score=144.29 TRINITY_DN7643_c0_g4_i1:557-3538(-)
MTEPLVAMYVSQVLNGLAYLHQQGVVHRDIKGANILMSKDGDVKLADFGVATTRAEIEAAATLSDQVVGTPYWMAPEVIEMTSITSACDIWSMGCLIIEILTGSPPYYDLQPMSALYRIVQDDYPTLPRGISLELRDFLLKCFQKDPQNRPSAQILLQHKWMRSNIESSTIKSSWNRTTSIKNLRVSAKGAHESVKNVVARFLAVAPEDLSQQGSAGSNDLVGPQTPPPTSQTGGFAKSSTQRSIERTISEDQVQQDSQPERVSSTRLYPVQVKSIEYQNIQSEVNEVQQEQNSRVSTPAVKKISTHRDDTASAHLVLRQSGLNSIEREMLSWLDETIISTSSDSSQQQDSSDTQSNQDADQRREERQAVRELVRKLQTGQRGNVQQITQALKGLRDRFQRFQHQRSYFLSEGGAVTLMELLDSGNSTLVLGALELINEVAMEQRVLDQLMLVGIFPVVMGFTIERGIDERLRVQAITFMHRMCTSGNASTSHMFLCCNGLYYLVEILRQKDYRKNGRFVVYSVFECIHTLLRAQNIRRGSSPIPLNHFARLLAKNGFVGVLVRYMEDATEDVLQQKYLDAKQHNIAHVKQRSEPPSSASSSQIHVSSAAVSDSVAALARQLHQSQQSKEGNQFDKVLQQTRPVGNAHRTTKSVVEDTGATDAQILSMMVQLLGVIGVSDTVVLTLLCERSTLQRLLQLVGKLPQEYVEHAVVCIQSASRDPEVHDLMTEAGAIPMLVKFLENERIIHLQYCQLSLLAAVENLCKLSKARQELAVGAGIAPILVRLAQSSPQDEMARKCRFLSIKLIMSFAVCTTKTRQVLWLTNGFDVLLDLLREPEWQIGALEVIATWVREDPARKVQQKVTSEGTLKSFLKIFSGLQESAYKEDQFVRTLTPLLSLTKSKEITQILCRNDQFVSLAVRQLAVANEKGFTSGCRCALGLLRNLYKFHHNPKELVIRYKVREVIRPLLNVETLIVRKAAEELMDAFNINYIF